MPKPPFTGLDKLLQTVAFSDSVMESVDGKLLPAGKLTRVSDAVFDKIGNIKKRLGYEMISENVLSALIFSSPALQTLVRGFGFKAELCVFDDRAVWGRSDLNAWVFKSPHGAPVISRVGFYKDSGCVIQGMDIETSANGLLCAAYIVKADTDTWLFSAILDLNTGGTVYLHKPISSSNSTFSHPRMVRVDTSFVVVAKSGTPSEIQASRLASTGPSAAWANMVTLVSDQDGNVFDVVAIGTAGYCLAYYTASNVVLKLFDVTGALLLSHNTGGAAGGSPRGIALDYDGTYIHLAYYQDTLVKYEKFSVSLASQGGVTVQTAVSFSGSADARIGVKATTGKAIVLWQETGSSAFTALDWVLLRWRGVNTSSYALLGSEAHNMAHQLLVSRPFFSKNEFHAFVSADGYYQTLPAQLPLTAVADGLFLLRWDPDLLAVSGTSARLVGQCLLGNGIGMNSTEAVRQVSSFGGSFYTAQKFATELFDTANNDKFQFEVLRVRMSKTERCMAAAFGDEVVLSGGVPSIYDGELVTELSFPYAPLIVRTDEISGGGLELDGTYFWKVVFKWSDVSGNVVWSETSLETSAKATANGKGRQIAYRGMPISNKGDWYPSAYLNVQAVIYRTLKDDDQVYYRVGSQSLNRFATDYYGYDDLSSDADIQNNEQIYTVGGELDAQGMPSCSVHTVVDQRLWLRSDEDPRLLFYSKPWTPGRIPEFNRDFASVALPMNCTALASGLGYVIAFGDEEIVFVEGRGPGTTGQNNDLIVRQVVGGTGTSQPMSVADTPVGVFFHDGRTFQLLAGSRLEPIGEDAEVSLRDFKTVISNLVIPEENTVRFLCLSTSTPGAYLIATFNWLRKAWSFHYPTLMQDTDGAQQAVDLVRVADMNYVLAGERAYSESGYSDFKIVDGAVVPAFYPLILETADLRVENLAEFRRVWRMVTLFTRKAAHGLQVDVSYDHGTTWQNLKQISETQITAVGALERLTLRLKKQKCSSIRFRFYDTAPVAAGGSQGFEAHGLTLEFGMRRGIFKQPKFQVA